MLLFLWEYTNKVDKQGRVSVPASFRSELEKSAFHGFVAFPHLELPCLEGWERPRMLRLAAGMESLPPMSAQYTANSTIMTRSKELGFDPEGRIKLTDKLLEHSGITNRAVFAGRGPTFQIWEPKQFEAYEEQAIALARANPDSMQLAPGPGGEGDV